jgi:hypothetical protein
MRRDRDSGFTLEETVVAIRIVMVVTASLTGLLITTRQSRWAAPLDAVSGMLNGDLTDIVYDETK